MIVVCDRTKFGVPNYNGLLAITTKPKVEEKNFAVPPCYEGKSQNNRNFIITFLEEYL